MVMGDLGRDVDVVVVGGGPGGYSAAFRCAELGLETVVVDTGKRLGGACLYEGCIPSKALLHVAAVIGEAERAKEFGLDFGEPRITLDPLRKWKAERVVGKLARGLASVAKARKVEVVGGRGAFEDSRSIRVGGEEPQVIRFKHAVIATGSLPSRVPGLDLVSDRIMDSTAALEVPEIPERLLVIGGGYIGLELGQVYAALGSRVTVVEMTDGLLPDVDRELVQPLQRRCEKMFAAIFLKTKVTGLKVAAEAIAGRAAAFDNVAIPAVVFTDPEVAWVGLMETEARRAGRQIKVTKFPWAASGRAASIGRSDGLTKLVVDAATSRVLGVGIVGPGAGELIAEASLAVEAAITAEDLALTIHAHPTLSEGLMEAAESLLHQGGAS